MKSAPVILAFMSLLYAPHGSAASAYIKNESSETIAVQVSARKIKSNNPYGLGITYQYHIHPLTKVCIPDTYWIHQPKDKEQPDKEELPIVNYITIWEEEYPEKKMLVYSYDKEGIQGDVYVTYLGDSKYNVKYGRRKSPSIDTQKLNW